MSRDLPLANLSVLVTCYNKRDYVATCFKSLNEMSLLGAEIVIIDDGSNDGSAELINQQSLNMIKGPKLKTTENRGLAAARDSAIELATSDFIFCLDIDDSPNISNVVEILSHLSSSSASAGVGNFWYSEQKAPGAPVLETNGFVSVNSREIREEIFDARGWWRYIYRRDFLMLPGNRFGRVFRELQSESFVLDDIYWMVHLAAQDFELLVAPSDCYITNYLLPVHNADARWLNFLRQVSLLPRATGAFVNALESHVCTHDDYWMFKKLYVNLWDHLTILPLKRQVLLIPSTLMVSWQLAKKLSFSFRVLIPLQLFVLPLRRLKRKIRELKSH